MKTFRFYSLLCVVMITTMLSVGFASCSKDDNDNATGIVGTWEGTYDGKTFIYVFGADAKGYMNYSGISVDFTYSYDTNSRYLTINIIALGTTEIYEIYTLTATTLSGKNIKTGGIMSFTRK